MQNQLPKADDVVIAGEIIWRFTEPYGGDAYVRASNLLNAVRGIIWRNGICTETGFLKTWRYIEGKMVEPEWLIEMVNEYVYRLGKGHLEQVVAPRQAEAIAWVKNSLGLPAEMKKLSSTTDDVRVALVQSPVMMFLFSLSQCNYQQRLADIGIEKIMAGQKPTAQQVAAQVQAALPAGAKT